LLLPGGLLLRVANARLHVGDVAARFALRFGDLNWIWMCSMSLNAFGVESR
jgi:hypothetical protein